MAHDTDIVRAYYDGEPEREWARLDIHRIEYTITVRYMDRYVRPGARVLDIGGGPGRYALHHAARGCDVTLLDLSAENIRFAAEKAREAGLPLHGITGDARAAYAAAGGGYDAVFCMGPLYHLTEEADRQTAIREALRCLRPGGVLFASFISLYAGISFGMREGQALILMPEEKAFLDAYRENRSFGGAGFTQVYMMEPGDVPTAFDGLPLRKLHVLGQEGMLAHNEDRILAQERAVADAWIDLAYAVCERTEALYQSEHLLYIGQKEEA